MGARVESFPYLNSLKTVSNYFIEVMATYFDYFIVCMKFVNPIGAAAYIFAELELNFTSVERIKTYTDIEREVSKINIELYSIFQTLFHSHDS